MTVAGVVCVSAKRLRLCRSLSSAAFLAVAFMWATVTYENRKKKSKYKNNLKPFFFFLQVIEQKKRVSTENLSSSILNGTRFVQSQKVLSEWIFCNNPLQASCRIHLIFTISMDSVGRFFYKVGHFKLFQLTSSDSEHLSAPSLNISLLTLIIMDLRKTGTVCTVGL